ncbi:MAG: choice-of-anchor D domain-containing protein [Chloroflexota bacterium]
MKTLVSKHLIAVFIFITIQAGLILPAAAVDNPINDEINNVPDLEYCEAPFEWMSYLTSINGQDIFQENSRKLYATSDGISFNKVTPENQSNQFFHEPTQNPTRIFLREFSDSNQFLHWTTDGQTLVDATPEGDWSNFEYLTTSNKRDYFKFADKSGKSFLVSISEDGMTTSNLTPDGEWLRFSYSVNLNGSDYFVFIDDITFEYRLFSTTDGLTLSDVTPNGGKIANMYSWDMTINGKAFFVISDSDFTQNRLYSTIDGITFSDVTVGEPRTSIGYFGQVYDQHIFGFSTSNGTEPMMMYATVDGENFSPIQLNSDFDELNNFEQLKNYGENTLVRLIDRFDNEYLFSTSDGKNYTNLTPNKLWSQAFQITSDENTDFFMFATVSPIRYHLFSTSNGESLNQGPVGDWFRIEHLKSSHGRHYFEFTELSGIELYGSLYSTIDGTVYRDDNQGETWYLVNAAGEDDLRDYFFFGYTENFSLGLEKYIPYSTSDGNSFEKSLIEFDDKPTFITNSFGRDLFLVKDSLDKATLLTTADGVSFSEAILPASVTNWSWVSYITTVENYDIFSFRESETGNEKLLTTVDGQNFNDNTPSGNWGSIELVQTKGHTYLKFSGTEGNSGILLAICAPEIELDGQNFDGVFGSTEVNSEPLTQTFLVSNRGTKSLLLDIGSIQLEKGEHFTVNPPQQSILEPEESTSITVTFSPKTIGVFSDALTISSNDSNEPVITLEVSGVGLSGSEDLTKLFLPIIK